MTQVRIEDRQHTSLELFAARHCQRHRGRCVALDARHDVQQMLRVVSRACSTRERQVVARTLALGTQLFGSGPDERVEPIERTGQAAQGVTNKIVTTDVCELVEQHRPTTIERPPIALGRQNDCRFEHSASERHLRVFAAQESRWLLERESVRYFPEWSQPVLTIERARAIDDAFHQHRGVAE